MLLRDAEPCKQNIISTVAPNFSLIHQWLGEQKDVASMYCLLCLKSSHKNHQFLHRHKIFGHIQNPRGKISHTPCYAIARHCINLRQCVLKLHNHSCSIKILYIFLVLANPEVSKKSGQKQFCVTTTNEYVIRRGNIHQSAT